jgi:hypothetical protein
MPAPCTVSDIDPVPGRLTANEINPLPISHSPALSTDHARLTLPILIASVITTRRVPRAPCPI